MLKGGAAERSELLQLGFDEAAEAEVHEQMGFETNWVQVKKNQLVMLDTFFSAFKREESLCFFYAKDTPLANDPRRVIIGVGRVKNVRPWVEYKYATQGSHKAVLWDRIVEHSIRPNFQDGFLFPYHEILKRVEEEPNLDTASLLAFAPEECWSQFSFASEQVTHDGAVASLLACVEALRRIGEVVPSDWSRQIDWIDAELNRLWKLRGPFPGLGSALKAVGIANGNLIAYDLGRSQTAASAEWHEDPWTLVDQVMENPSLLSESVARGLGRTEREIYRGLRPERRTLLRLLSRFAISDEQATRFYQETERQKAGINLSDADILANPYCLYEADRAQLEPIDEPATTIGEDRRSPDQARPVLLAPAGGEPFNPAAVRGDAPADLGAAGSDGLTGDGRPRESSEGKAQQRRGVRDNARKRAILPTEFMS